MKATKKSSIMTKRDIMNTTSKKKSDISYKWINISMFFSLSIPLILLLCLYAVSMISGQEVFEPVLMNAKITLAFIISMIGIFCGYLCNRSIKTLKSNGDENSVKRNLIILAISQGLVANVFGITVMMISIIKTFKIKSLKDVNLKQIFLKNKMNLDFIFSLFILFLSAMCSILIINIY